MIGETGRGPQTRLEAAKAAPAGKEQVMKMRILGVWLTALTVASFSLSALAEEQAPIRGNFDTAFTFTSPPPVAQLTLTGSGWGSHLGKATCYSGDEVVDFTLPIPAMSATLELTAANGDTLVAVMAAAVIPNIDGSITFSGTLTFTGGTGRFAGASGTAPFDGTGTPTSPTGGIGWFSFEGTVSLPE